MNKYFLLVKTVEENDINMTEIWGTFDELNLDTTKWDSSISDGIIDLRDYGTVEETFEWDVNPITGEFAELTRIG